MTTTPTLSARMASMGLSPERIEWWLAQEEGSVRLDDQPVTDGETPAPEGSRITLRG